MFSQNFLTFFTFFIFINLVRSQSIQSQREQEERKLLGALDSLLQNEQERRTHQPISYSDPATRKAFDAFNGRIFQTSTIRNSWWNQQG